MTLAAVAVAVASLFAIINGSQQPRMPAIILALLSVALGWLTIHMMAAIHYAHLYWRPAEPSRKGRRTRRAKRVAGCSFLAMRNRAGSISFISPMWWG